MGCFFSTGNRGNSVLKNQNDPSDNVVAQPPLEEETVKEVMSEDPQIPRLERGLSKRVTRPDVDEIGVNCTCNIPPPMAEDEVSDVSGFSQSVAAATPEKGQVLRRSPSMEMKSPAKLGKNGFTGDVKERSMTVHKSPSRRFEPSPVRRSDPSPSHARQNLGQRRDSGEISGRRSNSPATRAVDNGCGSGRAVLGRSASARRTGPSPGRVRSDQSGRIRKVGEVTDREEKWPAAIQSPAPASKESPEDPSVSLECFIFL